MTTIFQPHLGFAFVAALALSGCGGQAEPVRSVAVPSSRTAPMAGSGRAKNVILFIGDGMGVSTVTAARIYDGQSRGEPGEENLLSFEHFPDVALVKTYDTNQQVPDSAGTATALNTGVKTRAGVIDVGPEGRRGECVESSAHRLTNTAERLQRQGKAIGVVSTARLTHATPAAVYAHSPERDWENDAAIPPAQRGLGCSDIATQLVQFPFTVALGGGLAEFVGHDRKGLRTEPAADLPDDWAARTGGHFVTTGAQMRDAPPDDRAMLGLFSPSHMTYQLDRDAQTAEPTLSEMTATAIKRLSRDPGGYFLMVEAGRIDHAHHEGRAGYALAEAQELSRAVATAMAEIDPAETLVLVTADHSHVFTMAGYPTRGNPILGFVMGNDEHGEPSGKPDLAADGKPYTTLSYGNGPGAVTGGERPVPATGTTAVQQTLVPLGAETHGGEDVPLYATGPGSDLAHGVIEQNVVHDIILQALGAQ